MPATTKKPYRETPRAALDIYANRVLGEEVFLCRTKDISMQAMRFRRVLEPLRTTRAMQIEFQLPGEEEVIWAKGEIVREPGEEAVVVKFTAMAERHRSLIDGYVQRSKRKARRR